MFIEEYEACSDVVMHVKVDKLQFVTNLVPNQNLKRKRKLRFNDFSVFARLGHNYKLDQQRDSRTAKKKNSGERSVRAESTNASLAKLEKFNCY